MRRRSVALLTLLMVIEFLAGSCASSRPASTEVKVDPFFAAWNRPDSPGCGVGVSRNGAVIYEHGFGMASLQPKVPITSSTVFHLAGDPVRTAPDHALGYSPQANGWRLLPESSGYAGNAGMMSSVRDLLLWGDNYAMLMTPISPKRFMIPGATLEFSPAEAGQPQSWHVIDGAGQRLLELQLIKFDVSKADLPSLTGDYRSDELDVTYAVAMSDSSLVVQSSILHPVFKDAFVGDYLGIVRFFRDPRGAVAGFTLSRNSARGVRFERVKPGV